MALGVQTVSVQALTFFRALVILVARSGKTMIAIMALGVTLEWIG